MAVSSVGYCFGFGARAANARFGSGRNRPLKDK
jgi:hypothetical protein